jgi:hypothetical protein
MQAAGKYLLDENLGGRDFRLLVIPATNYLIYLTNTLPIAIVTLFTHFKDLMDHMGYKALRPTIKDNS